MSRLSWKPRVVVVGTGHAGMETVHALRHAHVDVQLIDRNNYHKFQPLLYQVATAGLAPSDISQSARHIFQKQRNFSFRMARVEGVDFENKLLDVATGPKIRYDYLVLAAGASTAYFGVEGAETYAFPLKNIADATNLRSHILERFEASDADPEIINDGSLTFVIVGGGPTGVETAGALRELLDQVLKKDFSTLGMHRARVILIEMGKELLPLYKEHLRRYTEEELIKRGVEIRKENTVKRVGPDEVELATGETLKTHTLIWAAGVRANPLADALGVAQDRGGRVTVDETLRLPDQPDVFVLGDMSAARDPQGELYPQLAPVAMQQGVQTARNILRLMTGESPKPFIFKDKGTMATIGRNAAVVEFPSGRTMKGYFAWLTWVLIHIVNLASFRNQFTVFINWIYNYFTWDRGPRIVLPAYPEHDELDALDPRTTLGRFAQNEPLSE